MGGTHSLMEAAAEGNVAAVKAFLASGKSDIMAVDEQGWTALHIAAWKVPSRNTCVCLASPPLESSHLSRPPNPLSRLRMAFLSPPSRPCQQQETEGSL